MAWPSKGFGFLGMRRCEIETWCTVEKDWLRELASLYRDDIRRMHRVKETELDRLEVDHETLGDLGSCGSRADQVDRALAELIPAVVTTGNQPLRPIQLGCETPKLGNFSVLRDF